MTELRDLEEDRRNFGRPLYCPICSARLLVETDGRFPEVHRLPDHRPATGVNLCCGVVVTVTIDFDVCSKCGVKMSKHPSGLCGGCYGK